MGPAEVSVNDRGGIDEYRRRRRDPVSVAAISVAMVTFVALTPSSPLAQRRASIQQGKYVSVTEYDPKRNAAQDLRDAIREAQRTKKNILLEVGGQWCKWCHILDDYFAANPELLRLRDKNFVTVKINFSEENENQEVLAQYPPISGYPHLIFLDASGKLLITQDTGYLESGKSYNRERMAVLLTNWGPSGTKL